MSQPQRAPDLAVIAAYQQQTQSLRDKLAQAITAIWVSLGEYRDAQMIQFTKQATPVVLAGQRAMSTLTSGYHAAQRHAALGRSLAIRVDPASVSGAAARNGVDPVEVYGRPFHLVWRQLAELPHVEGSIEKAIQSGLDRAIETAYTDLQLSKVQTTAAVGKQDDRVKWVQRFLEGPHSCGLCIVATTQRYHPGVLLPIHGGCDCGQRFVYSDEDPGQVIDPDTLHDVHQRIAERFGRSSAAARQIPGAVDGAGKPIQYRDVLITHEHGELGPVLGVRGEPFLGPNDLN